MRVIRTKRFWPCRTKGPKRRRFSGKFFLVAFFWYFRRRKIQYTNTIVIFSGKIFCDELIFSGSRFFFYTYKMWLKTTNDLPGLFENKNSWPVTQVLFSRNYWTVSGSWKNMNKLWKKLGRARELNWSIINAQMELCCIQKVYVSRHSGNIKWRFSHGNFHDPLTTKRTTAWMCESWGNSFIRDTVCHQWGMLHKIMLSKLKEISSPWCRGLWCLLLKQDHSSGKFVFAENTGCTTVAAVSFGWCILNREVVPKLSPKYSMNYVQKTSHDVFYQLEDTKI